MLQYIIKVALSSILIVAVSEASKKSSLNGGIFASVPLISVLAMIWLYIDTKSVEQVSQFSTSVFWLLIPSLSLFIVLPILLKIKLGFYAALLISIVIMIILYYLMISAFEKVAVNYRPFSKFSGCLKL